MLDDEKVLTDTQEDFVDSQDEFEDNEEFADDTTDVDEENQDGDEEAKKDSEVAEPKTQSKEENSQYRKMRLRAEEEARTKLESERQAVEEERKKLQEAKQQLAAYEIEKKHLGNITYEQIANYSEHYGVPEEYARHLLSLEAKQKAQEEKEELAKIQYQRNLEKEQFRNKPFFSVLEKEIDVLIQNPNVDVKTAYNYLRGERFEELIADEKKTAEKRTVANIQDRAKRKSVSSDGGSFDDVVNVQSVLSNQGLEMANVFGVDPRKIAKRVQEHIKNKRR